MPNKIILSATAIDNFQSCNIRWRNSNLYRLRKIDETDSRRQGTTWHRLQELTGDMDAITDYINEQYESVSLGRTKEEWEIERVILLYCMAGYNWYYQQQPTQYTVIASEIEFEIPIGDTVIRGKIDQLVKDDYGNLYIREFKSSSKSLDDSYWDHLNLDPQISTYILAINYMLLNGQLEEYGISKDAGLINKILYNVWHKPKIGPKFITQKASKELVSTGKYCDTEFVAAVAGANAPDGGGIYINNVKVIIEPGKKEGTYAIYETPEMFGARLLQDVVERPEFYFQEKELGRTYEEMEKFQSELEFILAMMQYQSENELWYPCSKECRSRFRCEYTELCEHNIVIDLKNPPAGFEIRRKK